MYNVSEQFKQHINTYGREIKTRITMEDTVLDETQIYSIEKLSDGLFYRTISQQINGEVKGRFNLTDAVIMVEFGVKYEDSPYEWINFGAFIVKEHERIVGQTSDEDKTKFKAYDAMLLFHEEYDVKKLNIKYPISIFNLFKAIATSFNIQVSNTSIPNGTMMIEEDKWTNIDGITYRNVLDEIASASGTTIMIKDDKLFAKSVNTTLTEVQINALPKIYENNMKSLKMSEEYGPVNILNLAREGASTGENDGAHNNYPYPLNWETIPNKDRNEIVISDNQIMDKRREEYAPKLFNQIKDLKYYPFEAKSSGMAYLEPMDVVNVIDMDNVSHVSVITRNKLEIKAGITEEFESTKPSYAKEQYALVTDNRKAMMKVNLLVDQQNGRISSLVKQVGDRSDKETSLTQDIDSINAKVQSISVGTNLILNLNATLDMVNNTYPYYIFNQNGLQTVFQTIQQTRHMGSPIFRVVADKNSVSGYSKQYEFKGKALVTEYAYIVPDTIYSYRCKRTKGNTPMDVYVVEYDGDKKQIKRTKFTLDGQNMIESFSFTPAQMTMWARLEFYNNIEEPFNIAEEMFVRGEPVKWSEDANEIKIWAQAQMNILDDTISMQTTRVDSLNNDIHNAGLEINAKEGITVWGKKFSIWNEQRTKEIMGVETISGKEQMFINGVFTSGDDSDQLRLKDGRIEQKTYGDSDFEPVIWFQKGSTYVNGRTNEFGHGNLWIGIRDKQNDPMDSYVVVEKDNASISGLDRVGVNSNDGEVMVNGGKDVYIRGGGGVDINSDKGSVMMRNGKGAQINVHNDNIGGIAMHTSRVGLWLSPSNDNGTISLQNKQTNTGFFMDSKGSLLPSGNVLLGWDTHRWQSLYLLNQPNVSSDKRYKYNIHDIDPLLLDSFEELKEKGFVTKHDDKFSYGYIAQDVERCLFKYVTKVWGFKAANEWMSKFKLLQQSESYKSLLYAEVQVIMTSVERRHRERLELEIKQLRREHDTLVEILKEKGVI